MIVIFIMSMHIDIPCTTKCNTKLTMNLRQCLAKLTLIMQYYDFLQAESCMNHDTNRLKTVNKLYRLIKVFTEKRGSPPPTKLWHVCRCTWRRTWHYHRRRSHDLVMSYGTEEDENSPLFLWCSRFPLLIFNRGCV